MIATSPIRSHFSGTVIFSDIYSVSKQMTIAAEAEKLLSMLGRKIQLHLHRDFK